MPGKKSRFWKNEKARAQILSGVVVALMVISAFTGLFLMSERASATTVVSEDFEDISDWTQSGGTNVEIDNTVKHGGTYSADVSSDATGTEYIEKSISLADTSATLSFWVYLDATTSDYQVIAGITQAQSSPTDMFFVQVNASRELYLYYKDESTAHYKYSTHVIPLTTWTEITLIIDSGTAYLYDGTTEIFNVTYSTGDTFNYIQVGDKSTTGVADYHIDDLTLTDTADYPSTNTPPTCSITSPSNGATVNGTVTIQGTASDSDGTVQSVQVKIDSGSWQTATGTTSWSYSWDTTGVGDGSHTIYARSYDGTNYSTEDSVTVTVDNTAPRQWLFRA